jgi:type VI secretion system secreted protein VgrG
MKSSVSLGYLVDSEKRRRGEGFEAWTTGHAVMRGGAGVFVTADRQEDPNQPHLEMQAALRAFQSALRRVTELMQASTQAKAVPADKAAQTNLMTMLDQLKGAGLIASAPAGIGLATPRSIQHAAGENVMLTAGRHVDISAVKRFTLSAGDLISLCAHKLGLKLFAAKGKVEIQAQNDGLDLFASKQLHIASANEDVLVTGRTKAVVASGGACVKVENGNIEFICPGEFRIKAASFTFEGPANFNPTVPALPKSDLNIADSYPTSR